MHQLLSILALSFYLTVHGNHLSNSTKLTYILNSSTSQGLMTSVIKFDYYITIVNISPQCQKLQEHPNYLIYCLMSSLMWESQFADISRPIQPPNLKSYYSSTQEYPQWETLLCTGLLTAHISHLDISNKKKTLSISQFSSHRPKSLKWLRAIFKRPKVHEDNIPRHLFNL